MTNVCRMADSLSRSIERTDRLLILSTLFKHQHSVEDQATELRKLLFMRRDRLAMNNIDYWQLSYRLAYYFHKDRELLISELSM